MTDAEFKKQIDRIKSLHKWGRALGLGSWAIRHEYCRQADDLAHPEDADAVATCRADWRYLRATVGWNIWQLSALTDKELEKTYVHELMHVFLNELQKKGMDHEERVAETLAVAIIWCRDDAKKGKL